MMEYKNYICKDGNKHLIVLRDCLMRRIFKLNEPHSFIAMLEAARRAEFLNQL